MSNNDTEHQERTDLENRVAQLEARVAELEAQINDQPQTRATGGIDQYDAFVLDKIEDLGREPKPRQVVYLYQEAGIRDKSKIKDRHKFLRRSGRIEQALEGDKNDG